MSSCSGGKTHKYYDLFSLDPTPKQFTVMVIKPDAVQAGKVDEIIERVCHLHSMCCR